MESALASLVEINSFTSNVEGGNRVGSMLRELFECGALHCEVQKSDSYADHLVFRTGASGKPIALVGHLDTVFPPGTFEGYRREGVLARGPGVLDMKGGLLVAGFALLALDQAGLARRAPDSLRRSWATKRWGRPKDSAFWPTPPATPPAVSCSRRGAPAMPSSRAARGPAASSPRRKGRAAHAGNLHHQGVNAIWALSRFVDRAQGLTDYDRGTTVNVGRISGGNARNTVPDAARAEIDIRFTSREDGDELVAALGAAAKRRRREPLRRLDRALGRHFARAARSLAGERAALRRICGMRDRCRPRRRRGAAGRRGLRRQHPFRPRRPVHRRARAARLGLPHTRRADRDCDAGAKAEALVRFLCGRSS